MGFLIICMPVRFKKYLANASKAGFTPGPVEGWALPAARAFHSYALRP
jgi:hypothetical protein